MRMRFARPVWLGVGLAGLLVLGLLWSSLAGPHASMAIAGSSSSPAQAVPAASVSKTALSAPARSGRQLVVYTADLTLATASVARELRTISALAAKAGGFVSSSDLSGPSAGPAGSPAGTIVIRVPATRFAAALDQIRKLGPVSQFSQSGQDVTQQHNNIAQELQQLNAERTAYVQLFSRATSMRDMLQIQAALSQVNSQIAFWTQQGQQLNGQVSYATITVNLTTAPLSVPSRNLGAALVGSLATMRRVGLAVLAGLVWIGPWVLLGAIFGIPLWWWRRRRPKPA
ncbi:MAG: DUF4349 domain-containing protein [Thermaerobacter sp.]|nr:DUF4349 domain-containing protein [Thermaerobacter sp.]